MGKFSRLGNDLYTGRRSINFVGRKWLWYALSGVIVLLAVVGALLQGPEHGHRVHGWRAVPRLAALEPGHPGQRRQAPQRGRRHRHRRRLPARRHHLGQQRHPRPDRAADRPAERRGRRQHRQDGRDRPAEGPLPGGARGELGQGRREALGHRPGGLPGARRPLHLGLLPPVEDVGRGDRGPGPRRAHHGRRLRALRLRRDPGDGHRPAHDPRLLALRHRRRVRQGP